MKKKHAVQKNLAKNVEYLNEKLGVDKSFDMIRLDVVYADRDMSLYLVDGFVKMILCIICLKISQGSHLKIWKTIRLKS